MVDFWSITISKTAGGNNQGRLYTDSKSINMVLNRRTRIVGARREVESAEGTLLDCAGLLEDETRVSCH